MCFSCQHGITDAESLHDGYLEFARAGAVNHGEEDHLVAKLCEVLKYNLRQKCHDLVQASAKDPALLSSSSDATSLNCHVQGRSSISGKSVVRKGKDLIEFVCAKGVCEIHHVIGKRDSCNDH